SSDAVVKRLAMSSVTRDLPWLGSPSKRQSLPAAMRLGQSQSTGSADKSRRRETTGISLGAIGRFLWRDPHSSGQGQGTGAQARCSRRTRRHGQVYECIVTTRSTWLNGSFAKI